MRLILCRHGNTFNPGDKVVMVGKQTDLPLVEKGRAQAVAVAGWLRAKNILPSAVYASELSRSREFAQIVMDTRDMQGSPVVSPLLNELDFGRWEGKSDHEICSEEGQVAMDNWQRHGEWPASAEWPHGERHVQQECKSFLAKLVSTYRENDVVVAVSHGGRLRQFLAIVDNAAYQQACAAGSLRDWKVATGHVCTLDYKNGSWQIAAWNTDPQLGGAARVA